MVEKTYDTGVVVLTVTVAMGYELQYDVANAELRIKHLNRLS